MESIVDEVVDQADLQRFRKRFFEERSSGEVEIRTQFEYSYCLIRSVKNDDVKEGIALLEDLYKRDKKAESKRDYTFYLAVAHIKLKKYDAAKYYAKSILQFEPTNQQALELMEVIDKRVKKEGLTGMAIVGGAALALGGLAVLAAALAKGKR